MEGAASLACAAADAVACMSREAAVMIDGIGVADLSKILIHINRCNVDAGRAGLAVVAVDAGVGDVLHLQCAEDRIVLLFFACLEITQQVADMGLVLNTDEAGHDSGAVEVILDALIGAEGNAKGRELGIQQFAAEEGLHAGDADAFLLAALEELLAVGVKNKLAAFGREVGCRILAEHEHIKAADVQQLVAHRDIVGCKAEVTYDAGLLKLLHIVPDAAFLGHAAIFLFIVDVGEEGSIDIIAVQQLQVGLDGALDGIEVIELGILVVGEVNAEVMLEEYVLAAFAQDGSHTFDGLTAVGEEVDYIDAAVKSGVDGVGDLFLAQQVHKAGAEANYTEFFFAFGKFAIFHSHSVASLNLIAFWFI